MLCTLVTGQPGHPDQFPYIDSWQLIAQNPPLSARLCYPEKEESKILLVQAEPRQEKLEKKKNYDPEEEELPLPPPYWGTRQGLPGV